MPVFASHLYVYTQQNDPEVAYVTCGQGMGFGGYQTALCFSRQRGVGVAVLCNAGSDSYELSQASHFYACVCFSLHTTTDVLFHQPIRWPLRHSTR